MQIIEIKNILIVFLIYDFYYSKEEMKTIDLIYY